mgnify:CR=1 FL=1
MGIGKKAFLEDYYFDEFVVLMDEWAEIHRLDKDEKEEIVETDNPMEFFGI